MMTILPGERLMLDSNALIFTVEDGSLWHDPLRRLLDAAARSTIRLIVSELSMVEVLAKPLAESRRDVLDRYDVVFRSRSPIEVVPITAPILRKAAKARTEGHKLADAIIVATAATIGCHAIVTGDLRLGRKLGAIPRWVPLDDIDAEGLDARS